MRVYHKIYPRKNLHSYTLRALVSAHESSWKVEDFIESLFREIQVKTSSLWRQLTFISGPLQLRLIPHSSVISVISDRSSSSNSSRLMSWVNLGEGKDLGKGDVGKREGKNKSMLILYPLICSRSTSQNLMLTELSLSETGSWLRARIWTQWHIRHVNTGYKLQS